MNAIFTEDDLDIVLRTTEKLPEPKSLLRRSLEWGAAAFSRTTTAAKTYAGVAAGHSGSRFRRDHDFLRELLVLSNNPAHVLSEASRQVLFMAYNGLHEKFELLASGMFRKIFAALEDELRAQARQNLAITAREMDRAARKKLSGAIAAFDTDESKYVNSICCVLPKLATYRSNQVRDRNSQDNEVGAA